jgi:hypothetical protein
MNEYHKINSIYKRDMLAAGSPILVGQYSRAEFAYLANNEWEWTEKVDGTNIRIMWDEAGVRFGGKTERALLPAKLVVRLQELFPDDAKFKEVFDEPGVCLYGEGYGPGIQKGGGNYRDSQDFVLFDIKIGGWWLRSNDVLDIGRQMGLDVVPVVGSGNLPTCVSVVQAGFESQWGHFPAEGIVARPAVDLRERSGERIIVKVKTRDFA